MKNRRFQFWIYFAIGWLFYAVSLTTVFFGQGFTTLRGVFWSVFNNVLPAVLLGVGVAHISERVEWGKSRSFKIKHVLLSLVFAFSWGFLTLLLNSVTNFFNTSQWDFILWGSYALQWQMLSGLMAYFTIASAVYVGKFNENLGREEQRNAELQILTAKAESARRQAELFALRSQLNPHFLFNTLHSVMALVRTDTAAAEAAIESFSEMLRYVLHSYGKDGEKKLDVLFSEEIAFVENYLTLEKMRLGKRLQVRLEIEPEVFALRLPAFLVQPLIENAINRGISPKATGGEIRLRAFSEQNYWKIVVKDDGAGANPEKISQAKGFGLRLIREMLTARYKGAADLQIETKPNNGFTVAIKIPKEKW